MTPPITLPSCPGCLRATYAAALSGAMRWIVAGSDALRERGAELAAHSTVDQLAADLDAADLPHIADQLRDAIAAARLAGAALDVEAGAL